MGADGSFYGYGGVDEVDRNGFVLNTDFVFRRFRWRKLHALKHFRTTMLVKFNTRCQYFLKEMW